MSHTICLGEILVDCFSEQPELPRNQVTCWTPLPGGAPANVACALAKLGNRVEFIGAVGKDHWGDALVTLLGDMNVGHQWVQRRHKAPTRRAYFVSCNSTSSSAPNLSAPNLVAPSLIAPTQNGASLSSENSINPSTFAGFSESDPAVFADAHLFAAGLDADFFIKANFLVISALLLAYPDTCEALEQAIAMARASNVPILVDVNWQPMFWPSPAEAPGRIYDLLRQVHFLKVSELEADWLFGTLSARAIAHQFPQLKGVLVTAGVQDSDQGVHYCFRRVVGHVPSFSVDVEDAAGAGDAFTAGFIHQLLKRGIPCLYDEAGAYEVVRYASAMGALTTTRLGAIAALPTANEVAVFLYLN